MGQSTLVGQTGASIYNQTTNQVYMFPLGTYTSVFQAEVYAICACAKTLLMESEASIAISLTVGVIDGVEIFKDNL